MSSVEAAIYSGLELGSMIALLSGGSKLIYCILKSFFVLSKVGETLSEE